MRHFRKGILVLSALAGGLASYKRRNFLAHLDSLDETVGNTARPETAHLDLPTVVRALAERLGAQHGQTAAYFEQSGQMWLTPGASPINFRAHQRAGVDSTEFVWRAIAGPAGAILVADYLVGVTGGLEVKLLGFWPLATAVGGMEAYRGEALRYLAELPLNPDAILRNPDLKWTVVDRRTIKVSVGEAAQRCEVTFDLDESGLIETASAPGRPYMKKGKSTERPWKGRFWDYERFEGRLLPRQAEVAWTLDGEDFVYWKGRMLSWSAQAVGSRSKAPLPT